MAKRKRGIIKKCKACEIEYYVPEYRNTTSNFCSKECLNHKQYVHKTHVCIECKIEFKDSPCRTRKWCSQECRYKNATTTKERRQKQKALQALGRGSNSSRNLRNMVFKIKPKQCENCGYNEYLFCLDLHHIDNNPNNNTLHNIAVLCCICHRKLHKGVLKWPSSL